jgi:hypothetical protein
MKIQDCKGITASGVWIVVAGILTAFFLLLAPIAVHAQNYAGSVHGTVTDPQGGSVAGADVSLRDVGTNATTTTTTTDLGAYSFPTVDVGTYEVTIKSPSFKEYVARNVEVHVSTAAEVNAKLELGASNEIVTVEANDIQVQTTTADVGAVIEGTFVRELPLNGRNFMSLTQLQPGVSANNGFNTKDKGLQGGADFSVNGNPSTNNLFLIDGVNNNDVGSNRTILIYPAVDSIAEFKMLTNSYGPEYGQASGAIISITTRSGENQFHGGLFYEGRNDALNAADFFNNAAGVQKAPIRRNDWGYHIGGPILKDKLFFWWSEEWNRDVRGKLVQTCVPTAAERAGDFSADIPVALASVNAARFKKPDGTPDLNADIGAAGTNTTCNAPPPAAFTGTEGNFVATSRIPVGFQVPGNPYAIANPDATGLLLGNYYPLPNRTTLVPGSNNNFSQNQASRVPWREENIRVDFNVTKTNRITFRYTQDAWSFPTPNNAFGWGDTNFATYAGSWQQPSKSLMARLSSQITPTLINDFEFGYGHNAIITSPGGTNPTLSTQFDKAFPSAWPAGGKTAGGIPTVWGGLQNYGNFSSIWAIVGYDNHMNLYTYQDNVTKIHGNHAWKFGGIFSNNMKVENQFGGSDRPTFGISNDSWGQTIHTGNALANILLPGSGTPFAYNSTTCQANAAAAGCPQQIQGISETNINPVDKGHWHDFEWYVGDTWKVTRRVTLTYGFRWSFLREPYSDNNQMASFSLAAYNSAGDPRDACNGVVVVPGTNYCQTIAATTGLPLSSGTPGYNRALVHNNQHNIAPRLGIAWDIFGTGKTALRVGGGQFYQRERVSPQVGLSNTAPFAIGANITRPFDTAPSLASVAASPSGGRSPRGVTPNSWQWNVSVEQQLARNTALQVGYVGNVGIHQTTTYDLNQVPDTLFATGAFMGGSSQGATPSINFLRPASNFGTINYFTRDGHSNYHSLQVLFRSKLRNFSTIQAAYTWSHTIANFEEDAANGGASQGSFTDVQNIAVDRGNATINRPNIFVFTEVFFLPKLEHQNMVVKGVAGGWEFNTIFTAENGNSISVYQNGLAGAGALLDPNAANPTCSANGTTFPCGSLQTLSGTGYGNTQRPNQVPGTSCNSGVSGPNILNPNAFTLIGFHIGTVGDATRGICQGPHYVNADFGLSKNWHFKERFNLRFSMDFFNAFNHANFDATYIQGTGGNNGSGTFYNGGGVYCGDTHAVVINKVTEQLYNPCSPTNNVITAYGKTNPGIGGANPGFGRTNATKGPRELQYGLKLTF